MVRDLPQSYDRYVGFVIPLAHVHVTAEHVTQGGTSRVLSACSVRGARAPLDTASVNA